MKHLVISLLFVFIWTSIYATPSNEHVNIEITSSVAQEKCNTVWQKISSYLPSIIAINDDGSESSPERDLIIKGAIYTYHLLYNKKCSSRQIPTSTQEEYLNSILAVCWYLYSCALKKDQPYSEGMLVLCDPSGLLFNFFMCYVQEYGDTETIAGAFPVLCSTHPIAYARYSSHFPESQKVYLQYGIDIRFGEAGYLEDKLPWNMRHILFGQIEGDIHRMFLRFEPNGLYYAGGFLGHAAGFVKSCGRKKLPSVFGHNDEEMMRKEHLPHDFLNKIMTILRHKGSPYNQSEVRRIISQASIDGIQYFYEWATLCLEDALGSVKWRSIVFDYLIELKGKYDHLDLRHGCEVILGPEDYQTAIYYYAAYHDAVIAS